MNISLHNDPLNHFFLITNPCFNIMHISLVQSRLNTLNTAFPPQRLSCSSPTPARPLPPTSASGRKWTRLHHLASCSHSHSGQREGKCQGRHSHPLAKRLTGSMIKFSASLIDYCVMFFQSTTNSYLLVRTEVSVFLINNLLFIKSISGKIIDSPCSTPCPARWRWWSDLSQDTA